VPRPTRPGGTRVSNAKKNADQIVSQAKAQAEGLLAETKADAERRRAAAQREVDDLTRQKDGIASHLAQVRQLLGGQMAGMAGMDSAMQAAPPKPAIAADPGAPRNGNSGAAPTTVQPVQSAGGHQATQVSPAPTQAQRSAGGPANGGAPAGTQATKQAANGKDDEDWWTE